MTEKQRLKKEREDEERIWQQTNYAERILTQLEEHGIDTDRYTKSSVAIEEFLNNYLPDIAKWWEIRKKAFAKEKVDLKERALKKLTPQERDVLGLNKPLAD